MTAIPFTDIPVSEIDLSDTGFRVTGPDDHDVEHLAASISRYGLLAAPLVMSRQDNRYIVVSGFRRIKAALHAGLSQVTCRVMPQGDHLGAALAAVTENSFSRPLAPAELVRATVLLLGVMDAQSIAQNAAAIFNMPLNAGYIHTLAQIHAMPGPAVDLLDQGQISIKACKRLAAMDTETLSEFLHLFSLIKVSSGTQMEIIAWANEICKVEKISLSQLIGQSPLGSDNSDEPGQGSHKDMGALGKQFKTFLAQRRFPALTGAKNRAKEQINALDLGSGLKLAVPENFEAMEYSLQVQFKSVDEFKAHLSRLAQVADLDEFKSLVDNIT